MYTYRDEQELSDMKFNSIAMTAHGCTLPEELIDLSVQVVYHI